MSPSHTTPQRRCFVCHCELYPCFAHCEGELVNEDHGTIDSIPAFEGVVFRATGNYGSTVFDPQDYQVLQIHICDECIKEKQRQITHFRGNELSQLDLRNVERSGKSEENQTVTQKVSHNLSQTITGDSEPFMEKTPTSLTIQDMISWPDGSNGPSHGRSAYQGLCDAYEFARSRRSKKE